VRLTADADVGIRRSGLQGARFGARVLRTETAGLALAAAATALLDW